jgi:hypothetical protein
MLRPPHVITTQKAVIFIQYGGPYHYAPKLTLLLGKLLRPAGFLRVIALHLKGQNHSYLQILSVNIQLPKVLAQGWKFPRIDC